MIKQNIFKLIVSGVLCGFSLISHAQDISSVASPQPTNSAIVPAPALSSIARSTPDSVLDTPAPAIQKLNNTAIQESSPAVSTDKSNKQQPKDSLQNKRSRK